MPRYTADTQSSGSVASGSTQTRNENIFSDRALESVRHAATVHETMRDNKSVTVDPTEHMTVALWEDLYNKVFLKGYSNNSQWYPVNEKKKQVDIGTFYFAQTTEGFRKLSLIFTEAKRANNATSTKPGETLWDLEDQLGDYCKLWLKAERPDVTDQIYANAVCGTYIRCFRVRLDPSGEKVVMADCMNPQKFGLVRGVRTDDYLDVTKVADQKRLHQHFKMIKTSHPPTPDWPSYRVASTSSRPSSSGSLGEPRPNTPGDGSHYTPMSGSPMKGVSSGSEMSSPEAEAARRRAGRATGDGRSASPSDQPRPVRQRSPPNRNPNQES